MADKNQVESATEPTPQEVMRNIKGGFVKARELTKADSYTKSKVLLDAAWKSGEDLIEKIGVAFFQIPPNKKYPFLSKEYFKLTALYTELVKTFQNTFRMAEEGYYRSAFGELRDILELAMKIKLFYTDETHMQKWLADPNSLYITKEMRKIELFKNSGLKDELESLSNALSRNRHGSSVTLDSFGPIMTNACYFRQPLFEKWCKHMIMVSDLCIRVINI